MTKLPHPGHDIRHARHARGWSQAELAERANVGVRTVRRVEAGDTDPDTPAITRLRHILGLATQPLTGRLSELSDIEREAVIEWALDEASEMQWLAGLARRFGRGHRTALPDHDLHLPRRHNEQGSADAGG